MEGKQLKLFKIRDLRNKEKFVIDDVYLNGYARILGTTVTAIYMSLCRHANKDQEAFPGEKTIAEEHGIKSEKTTSRAIKKLKEANIIAVERERTAQGKWLNNIYILLDRSQWKKPEDIRVLWQSHRTKTTKTTGHQSPIKETHIKETHSMSTESTGWDLKKETEKLLKDPRRHIQIIGVWIKEKELRPENKDQMQSIIKRNLNPARNLNGYTNEDIHETIEVIKNTGYLTKFTLETIAKYIDEVVAQKKKQGPKIIKFEEIKKPDGKVVVRPIYEKQPI